MTETIIDRSTIYIQTCYKCGIRFGMPDYLDDKNRENGNSFWCPNGHPQCYCITEVQRLKKELQQVESQRSRWHDRFREEACVRRTAERSNQALKGVVTRTKKRHAAGLCPCCNRTFQQLVRHMKSKHPDYLKKDGS